MDLSAHNLVSLFAQLGLDNSQIGIESFIRDHQGLDANTKIQDAQFWTLGQASFIDEAIAQDSDWCEVVDVLNSMLR